LIINNRKAILPAITILLALLQPSLLLAFKTDRTLPAEVLSITDGDTIVIRIHGQKEKVRLIGIDAPESHPNPKAKKDSIRTGTDLRTLNEMGQRSTRYVKSVIRPLEPVTIELDVQHRDKYGRLLAYIWLQDGRLLNEEIVRAGYAGLMTIPPNVRYQKRLQDAYRDAWEAGRGLWGPR